jgi:membrane protein implicated in regulation of membrane protease activity
MLWDRNENSWLRLIIALVAVEVAVPVVAYAWSGLHSATLALAVVFIALWAAFTRRE